MRQVMDVSCESFFIAVSILETDAVVLVIVDLALLTTDAIEDLTSTRGVVGTGDLGDVSAFACNRGIK